jgi:tetratricopeptide (TPR) repeat protein
VYSVRLLFSIGGIRYVIPPYEPLHGCNHPLRLAHKKSIFIVRILSKYWLSRIVAQQRIPMNHRLAAIAMLFFCQFSMVGAEPLAPIDALDVSLKVFKAWDTMDKGPQHYEEAKKFCQEAEEYLAKYDRESLTDANVLQCFADVEVGGKHIKEACGYYARALRKYGAVPAMHLDKHIATKAMQKIRAQRMKLGCTTGRYIVPLHKAEIAQQERQCTGKDNATPDMQISACTAQLSEMLRGGKSLNKLFAPEVYYFSRAKAYAKKGNTKHAISDFSEAIKLAPNTMEFLEERGIFFGSIGRYNLALADLGTTIKKEPERWWHYTARASVYERMGKHEQALADLDVALKYLDGFIKEKPDNPALFVRRGWIYAQKGVYDRAITDYDEAIRLSSDYADAFFYRGEAKLKKGDKAGADADFAAAKAIK